MSLACPETEQELIEYTKRKLGEDRLDDGTLEVDITDQQCKDLVADAIQMWKTYAYDGCKDVMYVIPTVTNKTDYVLPPNTFAVYGYVVCNQYSDMFSLDYQIRTHVGMDLRFFGNDALTTIELTKEYLALVELKLGKKFDYTFNSVTKILNIVAGAQTGQKLCVVASQFIDDVPNIYNEIWIKRYVEALFLKQWGTNFRQYDGIKLPGGVVVNWKEMIGDANTKIDKLEEELVTHWSRPVRFKRG